MFSSFLLNHKLNVNKWVRNLIMILKFQIFVTMDDTFLQYPRLLLAAIFLQFSDSLSLGIVPKSKTIPVFSFICSIGKEGSEVRCLIFYAIKSNWESCIISFSLPIYMPCMLMLIKSPKYIVLPKISK